MKSMFIYAKSKEEVVLPDEAIKELPKKVGLVTTIQYLNKLSKVKQQLPDSVLGGQVLGCRADSATRIQDKVDAFLYIGSGEFHPIKVALETGKPVFCYSPVAKNFRKLDQRTIDSYLKTKKSQQLRFLKAKTIGLLISTKIGQNANKINPYSENLKMAGALELSKRTDKKYLLFAFDTLRQEDLDNFSFVDCWINTACSRIADEKLKIVNIDDVMQWIKE